MYQNVILVLLSIYLFSLPLSLGVMEMSSSLLCIFGMGLFLTKSKKDWKVPVGFFPLLGLFLVGLISALWNDIPNANLIHGVGKLRWIFVYYFIFNLMNSVNFLNIYKRILPYLAPIVALVALFAFTQFWTGWDFLRDDRFVFSKAIDDGNILRFRSIGFFNNPLTYGYVFAGIFCLMYAHAAKALKEKGIKSLSFILYSATSFSIFISIVTCYSRGVWIALAAGLFVITYYINKKMVKILMVLGPVLVLAIALADSDFKDRIVSVVSFNDTSNSERLKIWHANWVMFKESPWLGVGYEYNDVIIGDYFEKLNIVDAPESHAHNDYLQFLVGTGVFGLFFFLWFLFALIKANVRQINREQGSYLPIGTLGLFTVILVGNLTQCAFKDAEVNHLFIFFSSSLALMVSKPETKKLSKK